MIKDLKNKLNSKNEEINGLKVKERYIQNNIQRQKDEAAHNKKKADKLEAELKKIKEKYMKMFEIEDQDPDMYWVLQQYGKLPLEIGKWPHLCI